jgi:Rrf2 family protein
MKNSIKSKHAFKAMICIASKGNHPCLKSEIVIQHKIPKDYLSKVLSKLVKSGLIKSQSGRSGGYKLGKPPDEISFLDIIEAMDGPFRVIGCSNGTCSKGRKSKLKGCCMQLFWKSLQDKLKGALSGMTLDKAISKYRS